VQRAAEAVYSPEGKAQCLTLIDGYLANAKIIGKAMGELGYSYVGGDNAPYIWIWGNRDSWEFFDLLLNEAGVVCTPGAGFGKCGQGYIRLSAFNSEANVVKAMERIRQALG
jgi:LL-diaminopimelate aminotransferase